MPLAEARDELPLGAATFRPPPERRGASTHRDARSKASRAGTQPAALAKRGSCSIEPASGKAGQHRNEGQRQGDGANERKDDGKRHSLNTSPRCRREGQDYRYTRTMMPTLKAMGHDPCAASAVSCRTSFAPFGPASGGDVLDEHDRSVDEPKSMRRAHQVGGDTGPAIPVKAKSIERGWPWRRLCPPEAAKRRRAPPRRAGHPPPD